MKTRTFKLNKLVRDKIVDDHLAGGGKIKHHRLSKIEKRQALLDKLIEEAKDPMKQRRSWRICKKCWISWLRMKA
jgi:predicted house-cleaning noncanonical NTP pyrophosphatase (MazG superfamily)